MVLSIDADSYLTYDIGPPPSIPPPPPPRRVMDATAAFEALMTLEHLADSSDGPCQSSSNVSLVRQRGQIDYTTLATSTPISSLPSISAAFSSNRESSQEPIDQFGNQTTSARSFGGVPGATGLQSEYMDEPDGDSDETIVDRRSRRRAVLTASSEHRRFRSPRPLENVYRRHFDTLVYDEVSEVSVVEREHTSRLVSGMPSRYQITVPSRWNGFADSRRMGREYASTPDLRLPGLADYYGKRLIQASPVMC